ncbi:hypothetical protein [Actinacidiphila bryophytorum]|uniref:hypothetical protein n=1 Tax=Actinacidiphila bryophytorum TaxID=1436133 RepID=UPI0019603060|nr:hypothetical protein [Actinacidiphila bryophytorum]MBM9435262.1 hypothetical protein [Actinacidiphila bryophytorum]
MSIEPHGPRVPVDRLLATLDPLPFPARMRTLAAWARAPRAEGELRSLLHRLETTGTYGRRLAAFAASAGGDTAHLEARLADPDAVVRRHALKAALRLPIADSALERAMDDAPAVVRAQIAGVVVAGGRTALAERLLPRVRELWGDEEAARLLPACGPGTVGELLPQLYRSTTRWRPLVRRHPDAVADDIARQLAESPAQTRAAWWQANADVFHHLADVRPLRVLDLLEAHCPTTLPHFFHAVAGRLLRAAPGRLIALLTAPGRTTGTSHTLVSRTALSRLARHGTPQFTDLGRAWGHQAGPLARLLRALPPSRREAFYDTVTAGRDLSHSVVDVAVLEALPRERAHTEARRMAEQAADKGAPWITVLAAVSHLPPDEARERLLAATRRPAAEDRAMAYPLLVRNAARSGQAAALSRLLGDLLRLRNEQDPVRAPALTALSLTPVRLLHEADAEALERLVTDAVEARDSSSATRQALSALAVAVLREHAAGGERALLGWALGTLTRLYGNTAGARLGPLDTALRKGQEFAVFEALRPWLEAGAAKADHTLTFALARSLGRRARHMPELQELLWQAVQSGNNATFSTAVGLWLDDPATRDHRVALVLDAEPSALVLAPVLDVVTRRRTDLLDPALADTPPYGRFLVQGASWLPPVEHADRWVPRQQAAAARLLARAAADASLGKHVRAAHIRAAAGIPEGGVAVVHAYAGSPDTVLAEAALGALVHTDRPADALPLLLPHMATDRARVALYAATRAAARTRPSHLAVTLRDALLGAASPAAAGTATAANAGAAADSGTGTAAGRAADPGTADRTHTGASTGAGAGSAKVPGGKVTSRKELVRLAGALLPVREAAAVVAAAYDLPGQHPDVQAVCVAVAAGARRSPELWDLLERAAGGPAVGRTAVLRTPPLTLPVQDRSRYAELVLRVAAGDDPETAVAALGALAPWAPWHPGVAGMLHAKTVDLGNRSSWRSAADGLVALTRSADGADILLDALRLLGAADTRAAAQGLDAAAGRDRPARQRIAAIAGRLTTTVVRPGPTPVRAAALRAAELLCAADDFVPQGVHLAVYALDFDAQPAVVLAALDRLAALHDGRPVLAARTATALGQRLGTARRPGDPLALAAAADRLAADGTLAGGLFAVALTAALATRDGWSPPTRTTLRALRAHPLPDVRDAALAVPTHAE